jgi:hypothetical protein
MDPRYRGVNDDIRFIFMIPIISFKDYNNIYRGFAEKQRGQYFPYSFISLSGKNNQIATHEIAHTLGLDHVFDEFNILQGTTNNFLDYNDPNMYDFWIYQLKKMNTIFETILNE